MIELAVAVVNGAPGVLALLVACGLRPPVRRPVPALVRHLAEYELDDYSWREFMRSVVRTTNELTAVRVHIGASA